MKILFLICMLVSLASFIFSIRTERKNIGYILVSALIALSNFLCILLFSDKTPELAQSTLRFYYLLHAWIYFAICWIAAALFRRKNVRLFLIPAAAVSALASVVVLKSFSAGGSAAVIRHNKMGNDWWVAERGKEASGFFDYRVYQYLIFALILFALFMLISSALKSARQFQLRYYILAGMQLWSLGIEFVSFRRSWPVWIVTLILSISLAIAYYFVNLYSIIRLKDWALVSFANEMTDGIALYDEYGDLAYMNDRLKYTLNWEATSMMSIKAELDTWLSHPEMVYDTPVVTCRNKDEEEIYFTTKVKELTDRGDNLGTIYILHDKTETIQKLKAMDDANRELEKASRMKADFLANMSHEIRTPMNAVIGMAEITMREKLPKNVMNNLAQIQSSGKNLVNIINDILDYSKIEAGKMEIIPEDYEPLSELSDISNVLVTRIGDKKLELFVNVDPKIPKGLHGDAMRIRPFLIHLAPDAIKFTERGVVNIILTVERIDAETVELLYHVKDTGQGIKTEDLTKLFTNFQQVDSKRNRSVEGTGLGLAISQRLCEAMDGRIGVTSKYGVGSDFYFRIPQRVVDDTPALVVDDASTKHAFVLNDDEMMVGKFVEEMNKLCVHGGAVANLGEYVPSGEKDYLFFEENLYGEEMKAFLNANPELTGVILVGFDSSFVPGQPNLRVMRRPETTIGMVSILNGREMVERTGAADTFRIDYSAPEARVLVVDDNAINITIVEGLLKPIKAQCTGALSGREALEKVKKEHFDIILMDHMMPEMDGVETTRAIRSEVPEANDTPIIAATANVMEGVKDMFIKEGMSDFVAKPIDIKDLITKMKMWLPDEKILPAVEETDAQLPDAPAEQEPSGGAVWFDFLDNEKAIASLGTPELFLTIVEEYYRSGAGKAADIKKAYDTGDWADYTIKVHALKSSSRQIGADDLGELAAELEAAGKENNLELIREKTDTLLSDYGELLEKLSPYFPKEEEVDESTLPEIPEEELHRILDEIAEACYNLDSDVLEEKRDELKGYAHPGERAALLKQLYSAIDDFDMDICAELIEQLRSL